MLLLNEIKELDALVSLIDEPNEEMFYEIKHKVLTYGRQAIPILEEAWVNTLTDNDSDRIEQLIEEIRKNELLNDISEWNKNGSENLIQAFIILMRYIHPEFDENRCINLYDKLLKEIWLELNENLTALEKIKVVNHVFFTVNKYQASTSTPLNPGSFYLNKLIDSKSGNKISLGLLYCSISQSLEIPVFGVNLPDHFILVYMNEMKSNSQYFAYNEDDVMFYINPGNIGSVFTHNEVRHYLEQANLKQRSDYYLPTSNSNVLSRMINELIKSYKLVNNQLKVTSLQELISIL